MPWCDDCAKFWSPPSLHSGECPTCGAVLEAPGSGGVAGSVGPAGSGGPAGVGGPAGSGGPPGGVAGPQAGVAGPPAGVAGPPEPDARPKAPWHFTLLLVALVLYLGYRAYQGVFWLSHHL